MQQNAASYRHDMRHHFAFLQGLASKEQMEEIKEYLQRIDATGVITGRRGKSRLKIGVLGSVSMDLLQRANCPVVVQP